MTAAAAELAAFASATPELAALSAPTAATIPLGLTRDVEGFLWGGEGPWPQAQHWMLAAVGHTWLFIGAHRCLRLSD